MSDLKSRLYRLLRWSERYTKTDMVYLAKGGSWMLIGQVFSAIISFGLAVAFANLISREVYGNYKYILSIGAALGALSLSTLGTFVTQSASKGLDGALRYSFVLNLKWSIPLVLAAFGGAVYYSLHGNNVLAMSLVTIGIFTPFLNSAQTYSSFLAGKKDFRRASIYNFCISFFQAACLLAALLFRADVLTLVLVYFFSNTIATLASYLATLWRFKPNAHFSRHMAKLSINLSFANVMAALVGQLDKILLFHFVGAAPVAVYTLAQAPIVQMRAILKLSTPLSLPKLAAADRAVIIRTLQGKLDRFLIGIILMVAVYIVLAPTLFSLLFPSYLDAVPYSQVYALLLLLFPKKLISLTLYAQEEKRGMYVLSLSTPITQAILLFIFVPFIGIWGAIIASIGANLVTNLFANHYLKVFKAGAA